MDSFLDNLKTPSGSEDSDDEYDANKYENKRRKFNKKEEEVDNDDDEDDDSDSDNSLGGMDLKDAEEIALSLLNN